MMLIQYALWGHVINIRAIAGVTKYQTLAKLEISITVF
jgi:hypothetical protein